MKTKMLINQEGFGLGECLVTLLILSILTVTTMSALRNSLQIQSHTQTLLNEARTNANNAALGLAVNDVPDDQK